MVTVDRLYNMPAMEVGKLIRVACTGDKILEASGMSLHIIFVSTIILFMTINPGTRYTVIIIRSVI